MDKVEKLWRHLASQQLISLKAIKEHQYAAKAHLEAMKYPVNVDENQANKSAKLAR
jgi:hypothetical protein